MQDSKGAVADESFGLKERQVVEKNSVSDHFLDMIFLAILTFLSLPV